MKNNRYYILLATFFTIVFCAVIFLCKKAPGQIDGEEEFEAADNPIARAQYEFNMLKNPFTNSIPQGTFDAEMNQARSVYRKQLSMKMAVANSYNFQGPNNLGGRTRAIAYDVRFDGSTNSVVFAGGVSGGIYKSTDNGSTWTRKSPLNQLFSVTSIAQDTRPGFQNTWYYATGEALGNSASGGTTYTGGAIAFYLGNGIYKSTDNGETWARLTSSNTSSLEGFNAVQDLITKVAVNPANGDVYMACVSTILRSQDGGTTWSNVLSGTANNSNQITDVAITSSGRIYAAFSGTCPNTVDGVWTSTSGDSGSWTRIAGTGAGVSGWNAQNTYGRVVLAIAPSNENIVYAMYSVNLTYPNIEAEFFKWDQSTGTWKNRTTNLPDETGGSAGNDPFAVQGGYDLVIAVKPDDENTVFIGGTNIYRSTDGFATKNNYQRIGGYVDASSYSLYANSHPDIHAVVFEPGATTTMLCGNDGGIQRTDNDLASPVAWTDISTSYRTYQYYYVAVDPQTNIAKVIGGAQDNGTTRNIGSAGSSFEKVLGGDGGSVGLSNPVSGTTYEYASWQQGGIFRRASTYPANAADDIRPSTATDNGLFVTLFKLDEDNTEYIYYASDSSLYRNTSASTATPSNWVQIKGVENTIVDGPPTGKAQISALATTRGTYNASTASLFIGTSEGRLYRLDDPANANPNTAPVNITGPGFASGGYISSIAVNPRNDDTVLVTFSNYGITSVWWTGDANSVAPTWKNVEGNLTLPSFRSSAIAVTSAGIEYFVGTSVGLYKAAIDGANPGSTSWAQEGAPDLGNAIVTSLAYRPVDGKLLVGTHGYGMWYTFLSLSVLPVDYIEFTGILVNYTPHLQWSTSSENRNAGFEIERSYSGTDFQKIGFVSGRGHTDTKQSYTFDDKDIAQSENYYRLRQIDADGNSSYSSIILIKSRLQSSSMRILQNPFNDHLDIELPVRYSRYLRFRLIDMSGKVVSQQDNNSDQARVRVYFKNAVSGAYILQVSDGNKQYVTKVIRQ